MTDTTAMKRGRFVTLENFILDTFTKIEEDGTEHPIDRADEIGGAGTYTMIGARIFLPGSRLGMIVDYTPGTLPQMLKQTLDGYGEDVFFYRLRTDGNPTLRAVNRYKGQLRIFEYLTVPLDLTPRSWDGTALKDPLPGIIHFVPMEDRLEIILNEVEALKREHKDWDPLLVWEPDIPTNRPENMDLFRRFTPRTHVISPNHVEALSLFSLTPSSILPEEEYRALLVTACLRLAELGPKMAAVLRCGHLGACYVDILERASHPPTSADVKWIPAYWTADLPGSVGKVVDPTGAGNAFMGGLGAALSEGMDIHEAMLWGTVAASFVIEQNGLPTLQKDDGGLEIWNGDWPLGRVESLRERVHAL